MQYDGCDTEFTAEMKWKARLAPLRVEPAEGFVALVVNLAMLTGYAHIPPLFSGLVCVSGDTAQGEPSTALSTHEPLSIPTTGCTETVLSLQNAAGASLVLMLLEHFEVGKSRFVQKRLENHVLSPADVQRMSNLSQQQSAIQALLRHPLCQPLNQTTGSGLRCPPPLVAKTVLSHVQRFTVSTFFYNLTVDHNYTVAVQISNGTHLTAPEYSVLFQIRPQTTMFQHEQHQLSMYLDALQPRRQLAPFESAGPGKGVCSRAFHAAMDEYRRFHAEQLARLQAVRSNMLALRALLTTDANPVHVVVSQVNPTSGLSDRSNGLLGIFSMAFLSRRLLLMDDDWPEVHLSMQPSIPLLLSSAAPFLRENLLADVTSVRSVAEWQGLLLNPAQ